MRARLLLTMTLAAAWGATSAVAQERGLFERLDKNADGSVAADEVEGDAKGLFERLLRNHDENSDGQLSRAEFAAGLRRPADRVEGQDADRPGDAGPANRDRPFAPDPDQFFRRLDSNGDGKLSKEEIPERMTRLLEEADANGDGAIDKEELTKRAAAVRQRLAQQAGRRASAAPGMLLMRSLDSDRDGELSAEELKNAAEALKALDKDSDGKLSREELGSQRTGDRPQRPGDRGEAARERLQQFDKNGDGKFSKEEAPERLLNVFDMLDRNGDGELDPEEIRRLGRPRRD